VEDEIRKVASNPAHVQSGDGSRVSSPQFMRRGGDPWDGEVRAGMDKVELRDRALYACERNQHVTDEMAGIVEKLAQDPTDDRNVGTRWAIATSRPAYRSAFEKFLLHPTEVALYTTNEERHALQEVDSVRTAWNEANGNQGGWAVPIDYDLGLALVNPGSSNPMRLLADVRQTVSKTVYGLSSAGVTAAYNTESNEATDRTPTVAQPTWTVQKADAWLQGSFEVLADSDLGAEVTMMIADARNNLEAEKFVTGTGGGEPYGVVTRCASLGAYVFGDSGSTVEKDVVISDVFAMSNALDERYQANASWLMHRATANKIRRFGEGTTGSNSAFWADLGQGIPPLLIGSPVHLASAMDSVVASGSQDLVCLLGDFRAGYRIYDRVGVSLLFEPLVKGANRRPTGEAGWYAWWRNAGDVVDQTAAAHFRVLRK
jgi:HK97 family phage major capsid protein